MNAPNNIDFGNKGQARTLESGEKSGLTLHKYLDGQAFRAGIVGSAQDFIDCSVLTLREIQKIRARAYHACYRGSKAVRRRIFMQR